MIVTEFPIKFQKYHKTPPKSTLKFLFIFPVHPKKKLQKGSIKTAHIHTASLLSKTKPEKAPSSTKKTRSLPSFRGGFVNSTNERTAIVIIVMRI